MRNRGGLRPRSVMFLGTFKGNFNTVNVYIQYIYLNGMLRWHRYVWSCCCGVNNGTDIVLLFLEMESAQVSARQVSPLSILSIFATSLQNSSAHLTILKDMRMTHAPYPKYITFM